MSRAARQSQRQAEQVMAIQAAAEEAAWAMDAWIKAIGTEDEAKVAAARDAYYKASNAYHALLRDSAKDEEKKS